MEYKPGPRLTVLYIYYCRHHASHNALLSSLLMIMLIKHLLKMLHFAMLNKVKNVLDVDSDYAKILSTFFATFQKSDKNASVTFNFVTNRQTDRQTD